jgi:hypothetical protein
MNPCIESVRPCIHNGVLYNAPVHTIPEIWLTLGAVAIAITVTYIVVVGLVNLWLRLRS